MKKNLITVLILFIAMLCVSNNTFCEESRYKIIIEKTGEYSKAMTEFQLWISQNTETQIIDKESYRKLLNGSRFIFYMIKEVREDISGYYIGEKETVTYKGMVEINQNIEECFQTLQEDANQFIKDFENFKQKAIATKKVRKEKS